MFPQTQKANFRFAIRTRCNHYLREGHELSDAQAVVGQQWNELTMDEENMVRFYFARDIMTNLSITNEEFGLQYARVPDRMKDVPEAFGAFSSISWDAYCPETTTLRQGTRPPNARSNFSGSG